MNLLFEQKFGNPFQDICIIRNLGIIEAWCVKDDHLAPTAGISELDAQDFFSLGLEVMTNHGLAIPCEEIDELERGR